MGVGTADPFCETGPVRGRRVSVWLDVNLALGNGVTAGIERRLSAARMMLSEEHRRAGRPAGAAVSLNWQAHQSGVEPPSGA